MPRIAIIGTGLIGTSLALALRQSPLQDLTLVGTDADHHVRSGAQKRGAFNHMESRLIPTLEGADIVVLAVPVMAMKELMQVIGPELPAGCLVTDVGSSKRVVLGWAEQYLPATVDFVGGHPMAGKETTGPESADPTLFRGRTYCILPGKNARKEAVSTLVSLAEAVGSKPLFIGLEEHDSFVAAASHLPFILSAVLVGCASKSANWEDIAQVAATGFRDVTRLASGDPVMHRDICVSNAQPIVAWIDAFAAELQQLRRLLDREDADLTAIEAVFQQAFDARARWAAGQVTHQSREYNPQTEIPTFAESMGEMFAGRKLIQAQKRMLDMWRDPEKKKK
ncbi:MAG: prephenate dehydrogenase/arogenate dehydrogenase family protein [Dehalococcoidia bacterium]|nr:prephenate dehydrogenase/arogenate dehydrogenase family protein [Dehalococcoidia bacterium]